jgi:rhodanese-related sulfurtransferase
MRPTAPLVALLFILVTVSAAYAEEGKSVTGTLDRFTNKFSSFSIITDKGPEIFTFTEKTIYKNTEKPGLQHIAPGTLLDVTYTEKDGKKTADVIALKVAQVAAEDVITTDEVAALIQKGPDKEKAFIFDSRPEVRFAQGRLPHAVSFPFNKWDTLKDSLLPKDKSALVIFYCQGVTCSLSPKAAAAAKKLGYTRVKVYREGLPGWIAAGKVAFTDSASLKKLVTEMETQPDTNPFFLLFDARSPEEIAKGFIPYATAMKSREIEKAAADLPKFKSAQIVVYAGSDSDPEAIAAFKTLQRLGYVNTAVLEGGFDAWKKAAGKVASGKPFDRIKFTRKVNKDEISVAEFKELLEKRPADKFLLDVRQPEEFAVGSIPGAKNIPLETLQKDLSGAPKDKEIITYCNTGAISSIADKVLKAAGYKSRYLNANVTYKDGKPVIAE